MKRSSTKRRWFRFYRSEAVTLGEGTVVDINFVLRIGRHSLEWSRRTPEGQRIDADRGAWDALHAQAIEASDRETVEWALDDLYAAGGYRVTAMALLRRIIDGTYRSPY